MQTVLNAALPVFALILSGYACAKFRLLGEDATGSLNSFTVYLALPALLFIVMTKVTVEQFSEAGFVLAFGGGIAITYVIAFAAGKMTGRPVANASIEGLNASYANVGYMGIPLCLLLFGQDGLAPAVIATLFTACVLFAFTIVVVESSLNGAASRRQTALKVAGSLARNPLVLAPAAGIAVGLSGVVLPLSIERYVSLLSGAASPCALVCIGLFLAQEKNDGASRSVSFLVLLKLVLHPAITAVLALYVFSMPPVWASAAILLSALPTGTGPFILAKLYNIEVATTSRTILLSHIISVVTVSLLIAYFA